LQAIHNFVANQSQQPPVYQQPPQQPMYQQPVYQQPMYQQPMYQGGGWGGGFMGSTFGQAIAAGAGFGIGEEIIDSIF